MFHNLSAVEHIIFCIDSNARSDALRSDLFAAVHEMPNPLAFAYFPLNVTAPDFIKLCGEYGQVLK